MIPPGQKPRNDFPRFGLPQYAARFPSNIDNYSIEINIDGSAAIEIDISSSELPRHTMKTVFHCATTITGTVKDFKKAMQRYKGGKF